MASWLRLYAVAVESDLREQYFRRSTLELYLCSRRGARSGLLVLAAASLPRELARSALTLVVARAMFGLPLPFSGFVVLLALPMVSAPLFLGLGMVAGAIFLRFGRGD